MDIPEYRQRQARSFYNHLREATNPVFFYWQDADNPMPQIGGEPRGISSYPFQGDQANTGSAPNRRPASSTTLRTT